MKKLKLLLLPLLMLLLLIVKTTPTNAALIDVWEDITCPADIDCTIRAASAAGINFLFRSTVGKDSDELTASDVNQMARGEWNKGMVSAVGKIGALAYTIPPTGDHFANIIKNTLSNNILNSKANAQEPQGSGDDILSIIEPFWRGTRNVAYGLFVVVMVAIGFMIILQRQLPTRTVVTFTYALPRILIGLVLITFSLPLIALKLSVDLCIRHLFTDCYAVRIPPWTRRYHHRPGKEADCQGSSLSVDPVFYHLGIILCRLHS